MKTIRRWMVQLGAWLIRHGTEAPSAPTLQELASRLVRRQNEKWPERDGECKRTAVYAQLVNTFPGTSKRVLSRAIEEALP